MSSWHVAPLKPVMQLQSYPPSENSSYLFVGIILFGLVHDLRFLNLKVHVALMFSNCLRITDPSLPGLLRQAPPFLHG